MTSLHKFDMRCRSFGNVYLYCEAFLRFVCLSVVLDFGTGKNGESELVEDRMMI